MAFWRRLLRKPIPLRAPPPRTLPPAVASTSSAYQLEGFYWPAGSVAPQEPVDPFSLVADELSILANRLRSMVVAEVPKLASAAEYFFKMGVEGKRFRPTVLLLMASALNVPLPNSAAGVFHILPEDMRAKQQSIAEITEMIHVASLLHDDVLDDAETRRGIGSLNFVMGNKVAVLAGDFLLSRACVALASLKNTEGAELAAQEGKSAAALAACRTLSEELTEQRFPAPRILAFKEGSSQARYFVSRLIPAHRDPPYEQEARFPQLRSLTPEQRARLKSSFLHFDDLSFCEWMRSLRLVPPEPS